MNNKEKMPESAKAADTQDVFGLPGADNGHMDNKLIIRILLIVLTLLIACVFIGIHIYSYNNQGIIPASCSVCFCEMRCMP